jgi:ferric-dicitrate binding protein FerR (iron transport regulator)
MRNLETKYLQNQLTPEELKTLRKEVNAVSDEEIAVSMLDRWMNDNMDESAVPVERLNVIKENIVRSNPPVRPVVFLQKFVRIAAAILLPVLLLTTVYLYRENRTLAAEEMVVATDRGERANITLPDGTNVTVNSESTLRYAPQTFNQSERCVKFEGEAYFDVAKKTSLPFIINTNDLRVKVLGTKFNLSARSNDAEVQLSLEEGHVSLLSLLSKDEKEVFANQQAVLDKSTGKITVISVADIKNNSSWRRSELIFGNANLSDVLAKLENNYDITITMPAGINISGDLFTGSIPSNNLLEALEIIKLSYHLNYKLLGNKATFVKK